MFVIVVFNIELKSEYTRQVSFLKRAQNQSLATCLIDACFLYQEVNFNRLGQVIRQPEDNEEKKVNHAFQKAKLAEEKRT